MPCTTTVMESKKPVSRARALLSKDNRGGVEEGEPSFRVYYGETGATVPFMWESQPGTPKHPIFNQSNDDIVPPLTPPPSYNSSSSPSATSSSRRNQRPRVFSAFLSSFSSRRCSHVNPSPTSSSSSSYSGPLSWSTTSSGSSSLSLSSPNYTERKKHRAQRRSHSLCSTPNIDKFPLFDDDRQKDVGGSPPTSMCFGFKKQGCYSMKV